VLLIFSYCLLATLFCFFCWSRFFEKWKLYRVQLKMNKGGGMKKMKYVLVTGGVVSGLGKGVTASSIGVLLKACGLRVTSIKIGLLCSSAPSSFLFHFLSKFTVTPKDKIQLHPLVLLLSNQISCSLHRNPTLFFSFLSTDWLLKINHWQVSPPPLDL